MTLNEVVWRQACAIKAKSDELVAEVAKHSNTSMHTHALATQTAIVLCYASYATGDISPMQIYEDIITQVGQLQSYTWNISKTCNHAGTEELAKKLYESCATLKKRLRKKLRALAEEQETANAHSVFEVTPGLRVAACT